MAKTQKTQSQKPATVPAVQEAPVKRTAAERSAESLARITTGNAGVDQIARTVVAAIQDRSMAVTQSEAGFAGEIKGVAVEVRKETVKKSARYALQVAGLQLGGRFAAKAWGACERQMKPVAVKAAKAPAFDETEVAATIAALLDD